MNIRQPILLILPRRTTRRRVCRALHLHQSFQAEFYGGAPFGITSDRLYILLPEVKGNAWMVNVDR